MIGGVAFIVKFRDARKQYEELEANGITVPGKILNASARNHRSSPITIVFTTLDGKEISFTQNKISREFITAHFKREVVLIAPQVSVRYLPYRPRELLLIGNFDDQNSKSAKNSKYAGCAMVVLALVFGYLSLSGFSRRQVPKWKSSAIL